MPLAVGARLGPHEILAPLGAGGMGELYRARDAKLNRDLARQILPDAFTADSDRVAPFEREARVLAPNPIRSCTSSSAARFNGTSIVFRFGK